MSSREEDGLRRGGVAEGRGVGQNGATGDCTGGRASRGWSEWNQGGHRMRIGMIVLLAAGVVQGPAWGEETRRPGRGEFVVVGYLPDYRAAEFDARRVGGLTDLIVFSAEPGATGQLDLSRLKGVPWAKLRAYKTRERVRLLLCVGGWERSGHFATVVGSAEKRRAFVQSAVRVCLEERLDGVDLDWEHPKDRGEQEGYAALLGELRAGFAPHGLMLSVTIAAWQALPRAGIAAVDRVHVMAYDHDGRHSTLEGAQRDVEKLRKAGVPTDKIILGLPFYGRGVKERSRTLTYGEIVRKYPMKVASDEVDGVYFNGPATIRRKTEYAREGGLGGVMIWEIGQDAAGEQSLLQVIREQVGRARK